MAWSANLTLEGDNSGRGKLRIFSGSTRTAARGAALAVVLAILSPSGCIAGRRGFRRRIAALRARRLPVAGGFDLPPSPTRNAGN